MSVYMYMFTVFLMKGWMHQCFQLISMWPDHWPASCDFLWPHWVSSFVGNWTDCVVVCNFNESCSCASQQNVSNCFKSTHSFFWHQSNWWVLTIVLYVVDFGCENTCTINDLEFGYVCVHFPGRVLNRFSKDTDFMDILLPITFCEFMQVRWKSRKKKGRRGEWRKGEWGIENRRKVWFRLVMIGRAIWCPKVLVFSVLTEM